MNTEKSTEKLILCNAFSLNMVPEGVAEAVRFEETNLKEVIEIWNKDPYYTSETPYYASKTSAVGHPDTAQILSKLLNSPVETCRSSVQLDWDTDLLVCQYSGPRLPEGATQLPEGASFRFFWVYLDWSLLKFFN